MLLCDVSLGDMFPTRQGHYMEEPQAGTKSTWGIGGSHPDWQKAYYEPGGAQLPGDMTNSGGGGLGQNEFIVYNAAQALRVTLKHSLVALLRLLFNIICRYRPWFYILYRILYIRYI